MTEPNPKALLSALEECEIIIAGVDSKVAELTDPDDLWELLERVRGLRGKEFLASLEDSLVLLLHNALPDGDWPLPDGRKIYKTHRRDTVRWDGNRLVSVVAARLADSWADEPPAVFADRVARQVAECLGGFAPSTPWRLTPLRDMGINPRKYRTSEQGRPTVEIVRG